MSARPESEGKQTTFGTMLIFFSIPILIFVAIISGLTYFDGHPNDQFTIDISQ